MYILRYFCIFAEVCTTTSIQSIEICVCLYTHVHTYVFLYQYIHIHKHARMRTNIRTYFHTYMTYKPHSSACIHTHTHRGCRFTHDIECAYPLPNCYFSECWVFCLAYRSLECVAIEFEPDDRGKAYIDNLDEGTCCIQRRNSASVAIVQDPYRHVYMLYEDEPEQALTLSVLASNARVNDRLLRYHSACSSSSVNGICNNTYGSYTRLCNQLEGYIPVPGNGSCVKAGDPGTYMPVEGVYEACPKGAWAHAGATSVDECVCPPGMRMHVPSWSNSTRECVQCGPASWANENATECNTCYPNSWSLPGAGDQSHCMCSPRFYRASQHDNQTSFDGDESIGCARARGTEADPCAPCPRFSNTTAPNATSIWDCTCNPSYVQVIDPGDKQSFVCVPADQCKGSEPVPRGGQSCVQQKPV